MSGFFVRPTQVSVVKSVSVVGPVYKVGDCLSKLFSVVKLFAIR